MHNICQINNYAQIVKNVWLTGRKEVNKGKIMEVKISWLIDEVGFEIYDALNQERKTDIIGNRRR